MIEIFSYKQKLRKILAKKRELIKKNSILDLNIDIFNKLIRSINFSEIKYVASFNSIRSEISTVELNKKIIELKKTLSLPIIKNNSICY